MVEALQVPIRREPTCTRAALAELSASQAIRPLTRQAGQGQLWLTLQEVLPLFLLGAITFRALQLLHNRGGFRRRPPA